MTIRPRRTIDLNADVGEGMPDDGRLISLVTRVNIACGYHAGDETTMRDAAQSAVAHRVAIGAHPGLPDRANFGRVAMKLSPDDVVGIVSDQIAAFAAVIKPLGCHVTHVKPHGALYHMAEQSDSVAAAIVSAVQAWVSSESPFRNRESANTSMSVNASLVTRVRDREPINRSMSVEESLATPVAIVGLAGGRLVRIARSAGLTAWDEAFADRTYSSDGTLIPRTEPGATMGDAAKAVERMVALLSGQPILAHDGTPIKVPADTFCIHGDTPGAADFAEQMVSRLERFGFEVAKWPGV